MDTRQSVKSILSIGTPGQAVTVCGWVRTKRDAKGITFVEVNDGSCLRNLQIVADLAVESLSVIAGDLATGCSIRASGELVLSPGKEQSVELRAQKIELVGSAPADYPLQKKHHSYEFLREIAHLRPRTNTFGAIARLRSSLSYAIHTFFTQRGFCYVHTPIITASDCEGAGKMFRVTTRDIDSEHSCSTAQKKQDASDDFFGSPAYLTVSGQLEGEIYACALGDIYTFGPTFRAENSNTARHLAEFWMIEPEMAFADINRDAAVAEEFVRYLVRHVLENNSDDLGLFEKHIAPGNLAMLTTIADNNFEQISYTEAIKILEKLNNSFEYPVAWGTDIQSEHERYLTETVFKKPVIVRDYPKEIKSFYMKLNEDGATVRAMDVLVPRIGELIGGSEREERLDVLHDRIAALGLSEESYWWYFDLRKYGTVQHAGFGLGFERLMLLVTGMQNIRDVIPFPRYPGSAAF